MSSKRKAFVCDIGEAPCGVGFTTKRALTRHLRESATHRGDTGKGPFECILCPQTFSREHGLKRHLGEVHLGGTRSASIKHSASYPDSKQGHSDLISEGHQKMKTSVDESTDEDITPSTSATSSDSENAWAEIASTTATSVCDDDSRRSLSSETDPGVVETCDKLCFLSVSQQQPEDPRLALDFENRQRLTEARMSNPRTLAKEIKCSICYLGFETKDHSALFKHLDRHFQDLKAGHTCNTCQVAFTHARDLQRHLDSAVRGDCGFKFKHIEPCSGHHPPPYKTTSHDPVPDILAPYDMATPFCHPGDGTPWNIKVDDDRFNFCLRIRHWEQAQLSKYLSHVSEIRRIKRRYSSCPQGYERCDLQMELTFWKKTNATRPIRSDPGEPENDQSKIHVSNSLTYSSVHALTMADQIRKPDLKDKPQPNLVQPLQSANAKCTDAVQESCSILTDTMDVVHSDSLPTTECLVDTGTLGRAVCAGDLDLTCFLLLSSEDPFKMDENGLNPLHYAALFGFDGILTLLLEAGASVDSVDGLGRTSLALAIARYHYRIVELLLLFGADPNQVNNNRESMLFVCSAYADDGFARLLIECGADVNAVRGRMPTQAGAASPACYPQQHTTWEHGINTVIQNAVWHGRSSIVFSLLDAGANLLQINIDNKTLVDLALERGHCHLADQLLARGVSAGHLTLNLAISAECSVALVSRILDAGVVVDSAPASRCLQQACSRQRPDIVYLLLSAGVRPETDALCSAVAVNSYDLVREFLRRGASLHGNGDNYDSCPTTPLSVAISMQDVGMAKFLLDQGADINQLSGQRNGLERVSPLMLAVDLDDVVLTKELLSHGADLEAQSYLCVNSIKRLKDQRLPFDGYVLRHVRAIDAAIWCGQAEIVGVLMEAGATPPDQFNESLLSPSRSRFLNLEFSEGIRIRRPRDQFTQKIDLSRAKRIQRAMSTRYEFNTTGQTLLSQTRDNFLARYIDSDRAAKQPH